MNELGLDKIMRLSHQKILSAPVGIQIDDWIAQHVMRWRKIDTPDSLWFADQQYKSLGTKYLYCIHENEIIIMNKNGYRRFCPSSELISAWMIVDKMKLANRLLMIRDLGEEYCCEFLKEEDGEPIGSPGFHKTITLAICRAALFSINFREFV